MSDVPNRTVRLFLQEAGRQYDAYRELPNFKMSQTLQDRFGNRCAYCGLEGTLESEHLVPMNRESAGLHAWGNIVPSCKPCNKAKSGKRWQDQPKLNAARRAAIEAYIAEYRYEPDVEELKLVLNKLYELSDRQTRSLIEFGLVATRPYLAGLHKPPIN